VDAKAEFPGGSGGDGLNSIIEHIRQQRETDFEDNLCRKMLGYALGRTLILSDEPLIAVMRTRLAADGYRFQMIVESIVTSPQFLTKRSREVRAQKGD